ncbi:hypothetical protein GOP47_0031027 [Adiantum capillus-veneris]|nr:hypothetical protein GOP47_0031027 [Adiantum capillus-veneris]
MAGAISSYICLRCSEEKHRREPLNNNSNRLKRFHSAHNGTVKHNPEIDDLPAIVSWADNEPTRRGLAMSENSHLPSQVHGPNQQVAQLWVCCILVPNGETCMKAL